MNQDDQGAAMNQDDKVRIALRAVSKQIALIADLKQSLQVEEALYVEVEAKAIQVLKAVGQQQVLFGGTIFKLGTDPEQDTDTLEIEVFAGLLLTEVHYGGEA